MDMRESLWDRFWRKKASVAASKSSDTAGHSSAPSRDSVDADLEEVAADLKRLFTAVVRGVKSGVNELGDDVHQVDLDFGLKFKAGLSDMLAVFADLDEGTDVRVKVTLKSP